LSETSRRNHIRIVKQTDWLITSENDCRPLCIDAAFLWTRARFNERKELLPNTGMPLILGCASESLKPEKSSNRLKPQLRSSLLRLSTRSFMQTRFQIREIDVSKVTACGDRQKPQPRDVSVSITSTRSLHAWTILDLSMTPIASSRPEPARATNIPSHSPSAAEVINETIKPEESRAS